VSIDRQDLQPDGLVKPPQPYGQAIAVSCSKLLFVAGQLSVDVNGETVGSDIQSQTTKVYENLVGALASANATFADVVKMTTFLVNADDVAGYCDTRFEMFAKYLPEGPYPTNTMVVIDQLPKGEWLLEIEAIAALP
jgi:enamine deaminase RidA (YjgF/YER057c/UK114 family)